MSRNRRIGTCTRPDTEVVLKKKCNIRKLALNFGQGRGMEGVFERLETHENLEHLCIWNYQGSHFPFWMENTSMLANVVELELYECKKCTQLPAFDKLESLQKLRVLNLDSVKNIEYEFLTMSHSNNNKESIAMQQVGVIFPKLRELEFKGMWEWEEWSIPLQRDGVIIIMPFLKHLRLNGCPKLNVSLDFRKFKSLEFLQLSGLEKWEGSDIIVPTKEDEGEDCCSMCYLRELWIDNCVNLKIIPHYLFPHTLRELMIGDCPELMRGMQPCLPPLLENLWLNGDTGVFPESLQECSLSLLNLSFYRWQHLSMPKAVSQLKAVQRLEFSWCETLDFELNELKHFTNLRSLSIIKCPILEQRFQSEEEWRSILSHVPDITIDNKPVIL